MTQAEKFFLMAVILAGFSKPTETVTDAVLVGLRVVFAIAFLAWPTREAKGGR